MYRPVLSAPRHALRSRILPLVSLLLMIVVLPSWATDLDDFQTLTGAQQAAKQLAAGLEDNPTEVPTQRWTLPPLRPLEPVTRHHKQLVRLLYTSNQIQLRLVRGPNTLVSPTDDITSDPADARRPILEHPHEGIMALELLVD